MKSWWAAVEDLFDEFGDSSTGSPVTGELGNLLLSRDFACDQEPEETLGKGLRASGSFGELCLNLRDGLATEADSLLWRPWVSREEEKASKRRTWVEDRAVPDERGEASHATERQMISGAYETGQR